MKLVSNALAVELDDERYPGPRTTDIFVVGRLVPWKAPILALRALRCVENREAVLRFFGDGPEQAHLELAAQEWGLQDRVRFEGWIGRPDLIPPLARAGVLVHPALHEEAGLCIAEALALGHPWLYRATEVPPRSSGSGGGRHPRSSFPGAQRLRLEAWRLPSTPSWPTLRRSLTGPSAGGHPSKGKCWRHTTCCTGVKGSPELVTPVGVRGRRESLHRGFLRR
jgi:hypothetical protein